MSGFEIFIIVVISLAVVGGVTTLVIWRLRANRKKKVGFDFATKHGIDIKLSPGLDSLTVTQIEEWTESVVSFWEGAKGLSRKRMMERISHIGIFMYDELYIERAGIKVNGICWPNTYEIEIATLPKDDSAFTPFAKTRSLFRHEISHIIVGDVGGVPWDDDTHHDLFAKVGLGA